MKVLCRRPRPAASAVVCGGGWGASACSVCSSQQLQGPANSFAKLPSEEEEGNLRMFRQGSSDPRPPRWQWSELEHQLSVYGWATHRKLLCQEKRRRRKVKRRRWRTGQGLQGMCSFNHLGAVRVGGGKGWSFYWNSWTKTATQSFDHRPLLLCHCVIVVKFRKFSMLGRLQQEGSCDWLMRCRMWRPESASGSGGAGKVLVCNEVMEEWPAVPHIWVWE